MKDEQEQRQQRRRTAQEQEDAERWKVLTDRVARIEKQFNVYIRKTEEALRELEQRTGRDRQRVEYHQENFKKLQKHIERMEGGILKELQKSREIMFNMVTHDQDIERARFELQKELDQREAEMQEQQKKIKLENERARQEMKRQLYVRLGAIGAPILVAITTAIVKLVENLF